MVQPLQPLDSDLDAELQPLEGVPRSERRTGRTRVALLALGLGAAAAASYALAHRTSAATAAPAGSIEQATRLFKGRTALELDLGAFIKDEHAPALPSHGLGGAGLSLAEAAKSLFEHVLHTSGAKDELTGAERHAFENRFITKMIGMADSNKGPFEDYIARARRHIREAKPVMTSLLANAVNLRQSSFTVKMRDWMLDESVESLDERLIKVPFTVPKDKELTGNMGEGMMRDLVPPYFDSRDMWPMCREVITKAHNQGRCGSCWVFGALGALDSRMCIATLGKFSGEMAMLSRGYGASCAVDWDGCQGGWPHQVYDFIESKSGIPSSSCVPYFGGGDYANHWHSSMPAPDCPQKCDGRYGRDMQQDYFRPLGVGHYRVVTGPDETGLDDMRSALYNGGPLPYALAANYEFMGYSGGIFDAACGEQANHAVQAIGFGEGYILSLNSWGAEWGDEGRFKVAPCMVYHFAVPGDIDDLAAKEFPLPFPSSEPLDTAQ